MSISIQCSGCQKKLRAKDDLAGKRLKCPSCGQIIIIPINSPATQHASTISPQETPGIASMGKAVVPPAQASTRKRVRLLSYAAGSVVAACLIAAVVFILANPGKDQTPGKNELAVVPSPNKEAELPSKSEPKPEGKTKLDPPNNQPEIEFPAAKVADEMDPSSESNKIREGIWIDDKLYTWELSPTGKLIFSKVQTSIFSDDSIIKERHFQTARILRDGVATRMFQVFDSSGNIAKTSDGQVVLFNDFTRQAFTVTADGEELPRTATVDVTGQPAVGVEDGCTQSGVTARLVRGGEKLGFNFLLLVFENTGVGQFEGIGQTVRILDKEGKFTGKHQVFDGMGDIMTIEDKYVVLLDGARRPFAVEVTHMPLGDARKRSKD